MERQCAYGQCPRGRNLDPTNHCNKLTMCVCRGGGELVFNQHLMQLVGKESSSYLVVPKAFQGMTNTSTIIIEQVTGIH